MTDTTGRPTLAKGYTFKPGEWPEIDGERIPWLVSAVGPLVEDGGVPGYHVLWLPIIVNAPMPTPPAGRPDGEPLDGDQ